MGEITNELGSDRSPYRPESGPESVNQDIPGIKKLTLEKEAWSSIKNFSKLSNTPVGTVLLFSFSEVLRTWNSVSEKTPEITFISDLYPQGTFFLPKYDTHSTCRDNFEDIDKLLHLPPEKQEGQDDIPFILAYGHSSEAVPVQSPYLLKCSITESGGTPEITWSYDTAPFPDDTISCMMHAQEQLLRWISKGYWQESSPDLLPESQKKVREKANSTAAHIPIKSLCHDFYGQARKSPENSALIWTEDGKTHTMSYRELSEKSLRLAAHCIDAGITADTLVAVTLPRGPQQVIAILGIMAIGAVYVPIGIDQPLSRRQKIQHIAGIKYILSDSAQDDGTTGACNINITTALNGRALNQPVAIDPGALAYVIFTSGSTGEPKGVEITHQAAYNTIYDINQKYSVNENDRILAVSALDFDLSVYDIFGLLAVGGGLVLLEENMRKEAAEWSRLIKEHHVTLWNSVPALLDMLLVATPEGKNLNSLRSVLVSGDWVGLDLPARLRERSPDCRFTALGGATEASIWSNYYEVDKVDPAWPSIPYGKPLANQQFRIVNRTGKDCPDMVTGELWIGGRGVAKGYLNNAELTEKSFVEYEGEPWYKTGDTGRYWPDGNIEFLGRIDHQVKIRGYRIELGEIEAALKSHEGVEQSVAAVLTKGETQHLVAGIVGYRPRGSVLPHALTSIAEESPSKAASENAQASIIEHFLTRLLALNKWTEGPESYGIEEVIKVEENQSPILELWLKWLTHRNILLRKGDRFSPGPRLKEILSSKEPHYKELSESESHLLKHIYEALQSKIDDYRATLEGNLPPTFILEQDTLSPESLSAKDSGTLQGLEIIAHKISLSAKGMKRPLEVAILGGRTGLITEKLLERIDPGNIAFTVMDEAPSMVEAASERLSGSAHQIDFKRINENEIPDEHRYRYDMLIGANVLHRYPDVDQGIFIALNLLRKGGQLLALEHSELTPIALVTSAVLDRAFIDFDKERAQQQNPMLDKKQWSKKLSEAGFTVERCSPCGNYSNIIIAECPDERIELNTDHVLGHTAGILPAHMVPEKLTVLPCIPLTANGKVNRKAFTSKITLKTALSEGELPHEGMEQEIADTWSKLLKIDQVGREQVFFQIGGDSLLATRFLTMIKNKYEMEIPLKDIFEAPLKHIAQLITDEITHKETVSELMEEGEI